MTYEITHKALEPLAAAHKKANQRYRDDLAQFLKGWLAKYARRNYSLSELQRSPKQRILARVNREKMVINAANNHWSLFGSVIHALLEEYPLGIKERRLGYIIPELDVLVHHQPDWLYEGMYVDYKNVSSTSMKYDKDKWEEQFNFGAWLFEGNGSYVHELWSERPMTDEIIYLLKPSDERVEQIFACVQLLDWRPNNPQTLAVSQEGSMVVPFPKWEPSRVLEWVTGRAKLHMAAAESYAVGGEDALPNCTKEETWEREDGYKVYAYTKAGALSQKAATGEVFNSRDEALQWASGANKGPVETKLVAGVPNMCLNYCESRHWCKQGLARAAQYHEAKNL